MLYFSAIKGRNVRRGSKLQSSRSRDCEPIPFGPVNPLVVSSIILYFAISNDFTFPNLDKSQVMESIGFYIRSQIRSKQVMMDLFYGGFISVNLETNFILESQSNLEGFPCTYGSCKLLSTFFYDQELFDEGSRLISVGCIKNIVLYGI